MKTYYRLIINRNSITNTGQGSVAGKDIFDICLKENEYFLGYTNSWELGEKDIQNLNLPKLKPGKSFVINGKKIYRYPKLTLPREKVDLLKEKENVKVVRDPNNADIHIVSYSFLRNLFTFKWEKAIPFVEFFKVIKLCIEKGLLSEEAVTQLKEIISSADKDSYVSFDRYYSYGNTPEQDNWLDTFNNIYSEYKKDYSRVIVVEDKNKNAYETFINTKSEIVFDTDILDLIDSELAVLSDDQYDNIENMLTSSDRDNRTLAVEMIANCNVEKSFNVVSGLYWWHYDFFKDTNNWNSVNVKSLRSRMKDYEGGHNTSNIYSFNAYIRNLAKDGKLTRFAVDKTRKLLMNTLLNNLCGDSSDVFKVNLENLYIADEIENMINE